MGDVLWLREWNPATEEYTKREIKCRISYILSRGFGIRGDIFVMSIVLLEPDGHMTETKPLSAVELEEVQKRAAKVNTTCARYLPMHRTTAIKDLLLLTADINALLATIDALTERVSILDEALLDLAIQLGVKENAGSARVLEIIDEAIKMEEDRRKYVAALEKEAGNGHMEPETV